MLPRRSWPSLTQWPCSAPRATTTPAPTNPAASEALLAQDCLSTVIELDPAGHRARRVGAMTGFVAAFTEGPIDFYKSQIQVQIIRARSDPAYKAPYTTVAECVRQTVRLNGFKGPFQGLGATLLRNSIITFYLLHWAACGFFFVARQGSFGPATWVGANSAPPAADGSSSGGVLYGASVVEL